MSCAPIVLLVAATLTRSPEGHAAATPLPTKALTTIAVSVGHCGGGRTRPHSGLKNFVVTYDEVASAEVSRTDAKDWYGRALLT